MEQEQLAEWREFQPECCHVCLIGKPVKLTLSTLAVGAVVAVQRCT